MNLKVENVEIEKETIGEKISMYLTLFLMAIILIMAISTLGYLAVQRCKYEFMTGKEKIKVKAVNMFNNNSTKEEIENLLGVKIRLKPKLDPILQSIVQRMFERNMPISEIRQKLHLTFFEDQQIEIEVIEEEGNK
jgi:p-aminobenzoyl-glutamate transporter AbgT